MKEIEDKSEFVALRGCSSWFQIEAVKNIDMGKLLVLTEGGAMADIFTKTEDVKIIVCQVEHDLGQDQHNGHGDIFHIPECYYLEETDIDFNKIDWDYVLNTPGFGCTVMDFTDYSQ